VDSDVFAKALDKVLALGANINMYMAIGGTSFGFEAGANDPPFRPSPTSYDYDAPISEAGDLTEKYFAIKEVIKRYLPVPDIKVNNTTEKGHYGPINLLPVSSLIHEPHLYTEFRAANMYPLTFEEMGQAHGFVIYETIVNETFSDPAKLEVHGIHDRGYVFVDGELQVKKVLLGILNNEWL
jgi:beta-galactosidase